MSKNPEKEGIAAHIIRQLENYRKEDGFTHSVLQPFPHSKSVVDGKGHTNDLSDFTPQNGVRINFPKDQHFYGLDLDLYCERAISWALAALSFHTGIKELEWREGEAPKKLIPLKLDRLPDIPKTIILKDGQGKNHKIELLKSFATAAEKHPKTGKPYKWNTENFFKGPDHIPETTALAVETAINQTIKQLCEVDWEMVSAPYVKINTGKNPNKKEKPDIVKAKANMLRHFGSWAACYEAIGYSKPDRYDGMNPPYRAGKKGGRTWLINGHIYSHNASDPLHAQTVDAIEPHTLYKWDGLAALEKDKARNDGKNTEYGKCKNNCIRYWRDLYLADEFDKLDEDDDDNTCPSTLLNQNMSHEGLPGHAPELLNLPGTLGMIQDHLYKTQMFKSRAFCGFAALHTLGLATQKMFSIDGKLTLNSYTAIAGDTHTGKSYTMDAARDIYRAAVERFEAHQLFSIGGGQQIKETDPTALLNKMPQSKQALHLELMHKNRSVNIFEDEIGDTFEAWTSYNTTGKALSAYTKELFTKKVGSSMGIGSAVQVNYEDVKDTRCGIIGLSTVEKLFKTFKGSRQGDGELNRWLFCVVGQESLEPEVFPNSDPIPEEIIERLLHLLNFKSIENSIIHFEKELDEKDKKEAEEILSGLIKEGLKGGMYGRMETKAKVIAAKLSVSEIDKVKDGKKILKIEHLRMAAAIVRAETERTTTLMAREGFGTDENQQGIVAKRVLALLNKSLKSKKGYCTDSDFQQNARGYKDLSLNDRMGVLRYLQSHYVQKGKRYYHTKSKELIPKE